MDAQERSCGFAECVARDSAATAAESVARYSSAAEVVDIDPAAASAGGSAAEPTAVELIELLLGSIRSR